MCLTWCRQRQLIYDNDFCDLCFLCPNAIQDDDPRQCAECIHYYQEPGRQLCLLTHSALPRCLACCHHNAPGTEPEGITVDEEHVGRVLWERFGGDPHRLLDYVEYGHLYPAAVYCLTEGQYVVPTKHLVIPSLYGVLYTKWEKEIGSVEKETLCVESPSPAKAESEKQPSPHYA